MTAGPEETDRISRGFTDDERRWQAVVSRDPAADGVFFYSVRTTGVYCRPTCAARVALRKNVRFHATCRDAEDAGFRPCKRCKPTGESLTARHASAVAQACRTIEEADDIPGLDDLASSVGMSSYYFHRVFKTHTGLTPKGYAAAQQLVAKVVGFVEMPSIGLDLPLDIRGTAFQQRVWEALRQIPTGSTASYADIAKQIGQPRSVRAVAQACGANALAVAIPCHRVVRTDGSLSGYRWGVERKGKLLRREQEAG
jgi:AraC family transcriptional regulator of adaptative response/methylated-DNA-[protein]-cysteine methyltransferase